MLGPRVEAEHPKEMEIILEHLVQVVGLMGLCAVLVLSGRAAMPAWLGALGLRLLRHDQALEILRIRLARGEITPEEFDSVRRSLENAR